jgi:hypothetical protein
VRWWAPSDHEARELLKALRLATSMEVFEALLAGEPVPVSDINLEWARRYGLDEVLARKAREAQEAELE